jgi:hypothetical protein
VSITAQDGYQFVARAFGKGASISFDPGEYAQPHLKRSAVHEDDDGQYCHSQVYLHPGLAESPSMGTPNSFSTFWFNHTKATKIAVVYANSQEGNVYIVTADIKQTGQASAPALIPILPRVE